MNVLVNAAMGHVIFIINAFISASRIAIALLAHLIMRVAVVMGSVLLS